MYPIGDNYNDILDNRPDRVYNFRMNKIAEYLKANRKAAGLTQEEFAMRSGLGLRFVRELERGKQTVRMDKVNQALQMFGMEAAPERKDDT
jgi:y4mF family transcriptional regulator